MDISKAMEKLDKEETLKSKADKKAFASEVQKVIDATCREFNIAFIVHPDYDEATFVSKETRSKDSGFEGVWYRPSWGGATGTMENASPRMRKAIESCWKLISKYHLVSESGNSISSCENGINTQLKEKVIYRLGYLACCP